MLTVQSHAFHPLRHCDDLIIVAITVLDEVPAALAQCLPLPDVPFEALYLASFKRLWVIQVCIVLYLDIVYAFISTCTYTSPNG